MDDYKVMIAPISRILLRYVAGGLGTIGLVDINTVPQLVENPDLLLVVAGVMTLAVEIAYTFAVKRGWAT